MSRPEPHRASRSEPGGDQSRRARGRWGEDRAAAHLRRIGFEIIDRNWRSAERSWPGELDLVATDREWLVFCEVKARRSAGFGGAAAAVDASKQERIRGLASLWLREHGSIAGTVRFDVITIEGVQLMHYPAAF